MTGVLATLKYEDLPAVITYLGKEETDILHQTPLMLHVPVAPLIEGFTFLKWQVVAGDFDKGIVLQAVYTANGQTEMEAVQIQPSANGQKLVKEGNVYILRDDKLFTISGQKVK